MVGVRRDFTSDPPEGMPATPDYGYGVIGGHYRERIFGLHKQPIQVSGTFELNRASAIAELDPSPRP